MSLRFDLCALATNPFGPVSEDNSALDAPLADSYVYGDGTGDALANIFFSPYAGEITEALIFIAATTAAGTLIVELRDYDFANTIVGSTQHAVETVSPGSLTNQWFLVTFASPVTVTLGQALCLVVGAGTGDYTVRRTLKQGNAIAQSQYQYTLNGFTSGSPITDVSSFAVRYDSDNTKVFGCPYTTYSDTLLTGTIARGLHVRGLTETLKIAGVQWFGTQTERVAGVRIYAGSEPPTGIPLLDTGALRTEESRIPQVRFEPFNLVAGNSYNIVLYPWSSGGNGPACYQIQDMAFYETMLRACSFAQGNWYAVKDNGVGGWQHLPDVIPFVRPIYSGSLG